MDKPKKRYMPEIEDPNYVPLPDETATDGAIDEDDAKRLRAFVLAEFSRAAARAPGEFEHVELYALASDVGALLALLRNDYGWEFENASGPRAALLLGLEERTRRILDYQPAPTTRRDSRAGDT